MIKNAILYKVEMPTEEDMLGFTTDFMSHRPESSQQCTIGFAEHPTTHQVVTGFGNGYCIHIVKLEKKLDNSAIKREVEERIGDCVVTKAAKAAIKDLVVAELLPHTLPSIKYIDVYVHTESNTLIVDTSSQKTADEATNLLRKAIGSLKATTLYVDQRVGLTETLANVLDHVEDHLIDDEFTIGESIELVNGQSEKVNYKNVSFEDESTAREVVSWIREASMSVKSINIHMNNLVSFNLYDGAILKSIKFETVETDEDDDWCADSYLNVATLVDISERILKRFTVVDNVNA